MKNYLKHQSWMSMFISLIMIVIGVIIIFNPNITVTMLSFTLGLIMIIDGILNILDYFTLKSKYNLFNQNFIYGIVIIFLGVLVIINIKEVNILFKILIGIWVLYSGIQKLFLSITLNKLRVNLSLVMLLLSIITIITGLYLMFYPEVVIIAIAVVIIVYSIINIISEIIFMRDINKISKAFKNQLK